MTAASVALAITAGVIVALMVLLGGDGDGDAGSGPKTAIIVDQLSLTVPNPDFIESASETLRRSGYDVRYVPGEDVTVDFYRSLPEGHYDLVIFRVHAGRLKVRDPRSGELVETDYLALFSGEPYDAGKYVDEQRSGRLARARYTEDGLPQEALFGIVPNFVRNSMAGRFDDTLVVMMGCDGLNSQETAEAFLSRGASAFVSWSEPVSAGHTDAATSILLQRIVGDGESVEEAVAATAAEVGPDPRFGAELRVLSGR